MGLAPYSKAKYTEEVFNEMRNLCKINGYDILERKIPNSSKSLYELTINKLS